MIRVTVELWPLGSNENKKTLAIFDIANDGTGSSERGNYKARLNPRNAWTENAVVNYPRKSYHVTKLVYLVLKKFYETTSKT